MSITQRIYSSCRVNPHIKMEYFKNCNPSQVRKFKFSEIRSFSYVRIGSCFVVISVKIISAAFSNPSFKWTIEAFFLCVDQRKLFEQQTTSKDPAKLLFHLLDDCPATSTSWGGEL